MGLCVSWKAALPDAVAGALQGFPLLILMLIKKEPGTVWTALFVKSISGSVFALMTKTQYATMDFCFPFSSVALFIAGAFKNIFIADSVLNLGLKVNIMLYTATKIKIVV